MIPKLSAPLVKDIRTGEGIAEWALGAGVAVLTACGDLGVVKGATFLTILAGLKGVRRGLLKLVAAQKGVVGEPLTPAVLGTLSEVAGAVAPEAEQVLAEIAASGAGGPGAAAPAAAIEEAPAVTAKPESAVTADPPGSLPPPPAP